MVVGKGERKGKRNGGAPHIETKTSRCQIGAAEQRKLEPFSLPCPHIMQRCLLCFCGFFPGLCV